MFNELRKRMSRLIAPARNAMSFGNDFLKYGGKRMESSWSEVAMNDRDTYTGYSFAAIRNRSNTVARIANEFVKTKSDKPDAVHPYLQALTDSPTFSDYWFWYVVSTYLDLEGVFYLLAVRAVDGERVGNVKEFKLLNPYNIRRVVKQDTLEVEGYVETRKGFVREIPKNMIIEIREMNPFDEDAPFAMTDASKENQFTLKTSGDYTRTTLKNNINAPGIVSTDVLLKPDEFKNFVNRVKNHTKGEPLFGNGSGAITYQSMTTDLKNAALDKVDEINREALFAISGVSKTIMGIEQSGTTRETARVQKDLLIEMHVIPRITLIIDALNQDYKNNAPKVGNNGVNDKSLDIIIDNPLGSDHDAEQKDTEVKDKKIDLYQKLRDKGYSDEIATKYVEGDIGIDGLGEPTEEPKENSIDAMNKKLKEDNPPPKKKKDEDDNSRTTINIHNHGVDNAKDDSSQHLLKSQQSALQNSVTNIEEQIVASAIGKIQNKANNQFEDEKEIITKSEKNESINELVAVLAAFYGIVISLKGKEVMRDRMGQFALTGNFTLGKEVKKYIKATSVKVAESHIETIVDDILLTARKAALEGLSQQEIISRIKQKYAGQIVEGRAKVIARTETNRAFTRAQFEADAQFIDQNELGGKAYKRWRTRSDNPCAYCQALEKEPAIPFDNAFRDLGDEITVGKGKDKKTLKVGFESLEAGNAHPNCSCEYELVILN